MSRNVSHSRFGQVFSLLGDAIAATAAVRNNRQPDAHTLRRLGIDPEQFARIGQR